MKRTAWSRNSRARRIAPHFTSPNSIAVVIALPQRAVWTISGDCHFDVRVKEFAFLVPKQAISRLSEKVAGNMHTRALNLRAEVDEGQRTVIPGSK
jgi:hypothetical protein